MKGYREPGFQDRASASAKAKTIALAKLKAAPMKDEAEVAARVARQAEREAKEQAKRDAVRAAKEQALLAEQAKAEAAQQEAAAAAQEAIEAQAAVPTEEERKAERDARYAARKNRKSGKSR